MSSFGDRLRRERELRGIDLREIADATKISLRFLQAIEQDRMDVLPGGMFPRAFVRQYARYLGLDAERLVSEFLFDQDAESKPGPLVPTRDARRRTAFLVPALVLTAGLIALSRRSIQTPTDPGTLHAPSAPPLEPRDRVYPLPEVPRETEAPLPDAAPLVLTLRAIENCWVEVKVDGQTSLNRVLRAGESETLTAKGEFVLSVGNAGALAFSVNDRRGMTLGRGGEVRRNIVITRENLPSLVEDTPATRATHSS